MNTIATILAAMLAVVLALPVLAQGQVPAFCLATDPADPDYDIADYDPVRDADDWCKLAYNEPHKARRQLSKAVALVRSENNPNRFYWDPRIEGDTEHIQLLRPWMVEQGWWIKRRSGSRPHETRIWYFTEDHLELPTEQRRNGYVQEYPAHPAFYLEIGGPSGIGRRVIGDRYSAHLIGSGGSRWQDSKFFYFFIDTLSATFERLGDNEFSRCLQPRCGCNT